MDCNCPSIGGDMCHMGEGCRAWEKVKRLSLQRDGAHPAPCARSCEANAYEIQIRQLSAERDALVAKLKDAEHDRDEFRRVMNGFAEHRLPHRRGPAMKAHLFRDLVNDLRDIATDWHDSQQLRERISGRLRQDVRIDDDPASETSGGMTRDDVIRLAREAGIVLCSDPLDESEKAQLCRFAALVAAAEREASAKALDNSLFRCQVEAAAAIRARGPK